MRRLRSDLCRIQLAYVVKGICVIRYDNEAGKGDHSQDSPYAFTGVDPLLAAFQDDKKGSTVKTVTLDVRAPSEALAEFAQVWKTGQGARSDRISFATPELLWKVLTAKRWELLKALCGAGPVTVRDAAGRVGRDVKAVHMDLTALVSAGVLSRTAAGQVEFPYEAVKVEFLLQAA